MVKPFRVLPVLLSVLLPLGASAEERTFDFRRRIPDAPETRTRSSLDAGNDVVATYVAKNESALEAARKTLAVGDELSVLLFENDPLRIRLAEKVPGTADNDCFLGTLGGPDGDLDAVVVRDRGGIQLDINDFRNGRVYTVYSENGVSRVTERKNGGMARTCRTIEPPKPEGWRDGEASAFSAVRTDSKSGPVFVDVLVAYDTTAVDWLSGEGASMESFANVAVQKMNEAIANTDLDSDFRFRLVGTMETGSSALGSLQGALYAASGKPVSVNGTSLSWPSVKTMRDALGADIVCVLIDTGSSYGTTGLGYSMTASTRRYFSDSTFNACAIRAVASSHTMTHEVGHNMGAGHTDMVADEDNRGPQLFSYSSGYYFTANGTSYHTVMAYNSDGYGNSYSEAPYFSSPLHRHEGTTVGDSTHDNTLTLASTFAEVAAYRSAVVPDEPPPAPTGVSASNGTFEDKVRVSWNYSSGATSYEVWRSTSASGTKTRIGTTTATSWNDDTAVPETTYWYWIKAANGAGTSGFSASASGYCTQTIDRTIAEGLDATQFSWTTSESYPWNYTQETSSDGEDSAQSGGIGGYDTTWIETSVQGPSDISFKYRKNFYSARFFVTVDGSERYSDSENAHGDSTWRTVSFAIGSGVHSIRINYTHNGTGYSYEHNGVWVDRFQAVGGSAPTAPSAPTGVSASDGTYTDKVYVSWSASSGATSYTVYRSTSSSGTKSSLVSTASTSWNDTTATAGTTYYYWVKASNSAGTSGYSSYDTGYRASAPSRPGNDNFSNASSISGSSGSTSGSNLNATRETGEPSHAGQSSSLSVWWRWTAPGNGTAVFDTNGSSFDTVLAVYTGSSVSALSSIASNDDWDDTACSRCEFSVTSGTTYRIAVGGYSSNTGSIALNWSFSSSSTAPTAPSWVDASDGYDDYVYVEWGSSSGATGYDVYRSTSYSGSKTWLDWTDSTCYYDYGATPGTTYYYWVKASNDYGTSGYSDYDTGYVYGGGGGGTVSIPEAVDNGTLSFTTGGDAAWFGQSSETYDGEDAAQSGRISNDESTWFETTVSGQGTISFRWKVSSEDGWDYLRFIVNGNEDQAISGESEWVQVSRTFAGTGRRTLRWEYSKDYSDSDGSDCGWVDQIAWEPLPRDPPSTPSWVEASDGNYTSRVRVSWEESSGASFYEVFRATSTYGTKTSLGTTTSTHWNDRTGTAGTTYYYWVKASNGVGASGFCGPDSGYRARGGSSAGSKYALCVGINEYSPDYGASSLSGCVNDARYFRNNLVELGGWNRGNTTVLTDGQATKRAIRAAIAGYAARAVAGDTFVYQHSSHGDWYYGTSVCLCVYDDDYTDTELAEDLALFRSGVKVVVIADACHSGGLFKGRHGAGEAKRAKFDLAERVSAIIGEMRTREGKAGAKGISARISASEIGWVTAADYNESSEDGGSYEDDGSAIGGVFLTAFTRSWWSGDSDSDGDGLFDAYEGWNGTREYCSWYGGFNPQYLNESVLRSVELGDCDRPSASGPSPVYRFYSRNYRGHFFTTDGDEKDSLVATNPNWRYEGIAYLAFPRPAHGTVPVYRFYSKRYRGHFFTIDDDEMQTVRDTNPNWRYEGIAYYVFPAEGSGTVPVFRFWSKGYRHHFYTTSAAERDDLIAHNPNWNYEGIAYYAISADSRSAGSRGVSAPRDLAWTLESVAQGAPVAPGVTDVGDAFVETRDDMPNADELAAGGAGVDPADAVALRLAPPAGVWRVSLWSAADGTVAEEDAEGAFDFNLPASGVWHWLRVRDADEDADDAFSVWLRAE